MISKLDEIFKIKNDDDFTSELFRFIQRDEKSFSIHKLNRHERTIILIISGQGIIDNGGFQYFFCNNFKEPPDYNWFTQAYNDIGAIECAKAFQEFLDLFPNSKPQFDIEIRRKFMKNKIKPEKNEKIQRLESLFFSKSHENYSKLAIYSRKNKEYFFKEIN